MTFLPPKGRPDRFLFGEFWPIFEGRSVSFREWGSNKSTTWNFEPRFGGVTFNGEKPGKSFHPFICKLSENLCFPTLRARYGIRSNNHLRQAPSWLEPSGLTRKSWTHLWSWLSARTRLLPMSRGRKSMRLHLICNVSRSIAWATQAPPRGVAPAADGGRNGGSAPFPAQKRERGCACVALFAWVCLRSTAPPRRRPLKDEWSPGRPGDSADGWVAGCTSVVDNLLCCRWDCCSKACPESVLKLIERLLAYPE